MLVEILNTLIDQTITPRLLHNLHHLKLCGRIGVTLKTDHDGPHVVRNGSADGGAYIVKGCTLCKCQSVGDDGRSTGFVIVPSINLDASTALGDDIGIRVW